MAASAATTMPASVLLVSYHFGRDAPTGGVRWNAMATELARRGWQVDALTLARPGHDQGPTLPYDLAPGVHVWPVREPSWPRTPWRFLARVAQLLRRWQGTPRDTPATSVRPQDVRVWRPGTHMSARFEAMNDLAAAENWMARYLWCLRVRKLGRALARRGQYTCVVVSSPPHVTQLAGALLARDASLPLVMDLRDPWILGHPEIRIEGRLDRLLGRLLEPRILRRAHTIILNTRRMADAAAAVPAATGRRLLVIPNGYDRLSRIGPPDPNRFRIVYCGNLYLFMDPRPLFAACARLVRRAALPTGRWSLEFVGPGDEFGSVTLTSLARAYGLGESFVLHPRMSREEALQYQQSAAVLVVFDSPYPYVVPMKFYDHAQMRGTMLVLAWPDGALADIAAELSLPVCHPDDDAAVDAALDAGLLRWRRGDFSQAIDSGGLLDRVHQTDRVEMALGAIARTDERRAPVP